MATAKKLKSGSWRCLVYDYKDSEGKRYYKSFTSTDSSSKGKREAEYLAAQYAINKKEQRKGHVAKSFSDELEEYIVSKSSVLSPSTIRGYKNIQTILELNFANFCRKNTNEITQDDVQKVISVLAETKAPKTVRNYHGLISAVIGSNLHLNTTLPQSYTAGSLYTLRSGNSKAC